MTRGYSIIDHPSDLGIEARGESLPEAFEEAAAGLMGLIVDPLSVGTTEARDITVTGDDIEHLLVKWLSEILFLYDGKHFVPKAFKIYELTPHVVRANILGEPFLEGYHTTRIDVKAVTYHQISVMETSRGVLLRVFLDI